MSGIPEKQLRKRENNRIQTGSRSPHKNHEHQSVIDYMEQGGSIKVYGPTCSGEHKKQPHLKFKLEDL